MGIDSKKIAEFFTKRGFSVIIIGFLLVVTLFEYAYWKFFYLPSHSPGEEIIVGNKVEEEKLKFLIDNIIRKEDYFEQSLGKEYRNPFE